MKKIMTIALGCALTLFATTSCSSEKGNVYFGSKKLSGEVVTQNRNVKCFDKIYIEGCPTVYYAQGSKPSVVVKADKAIIDNIKTTVTGNTLTISYKGNSSIVVFNGSFNSSDAMSIYITSPDITGVILQGSGDFISEKKVDTDNMDIQLKGSGDIKFGSIICDNISTTLVGSGDIDVKNADALKADIELVGSGDLDMNLSNTKNTNISLKGSGDIDVNFKNCVSVNSQLKGSGDIELKGDVEHFTKDELGSGEHDTSKLRVGNH